MNLLTAIFSGALVTFSNHWFREAPLNDGNDNHICLLHVTLLSRMSNIFTKA